MKKIYSFIFFLSLLSFSSLKAQNTYVPDDNFEQALIDLGYDSGVLNDSVPSANIDTITILDVSYMNIYDLIGIEEFVSLEELICIGNNLTSLNLSYNINIIILHCSLNQISNLNVNNNSNIEYLNCDQNQITNLNLSNLPNLKHLLCYNNLLTNLNLSNNPSLQVLGTQNNNLTNLDLSTNINLNSLYCEFNNINSINLLSNSLLYDLSISNNFLTNLDLSGNSQLNNLSCDNNMISILDISPINGLTNLVCNNNNLTQLILDNGFSNPTIIENLDIRNNNITSINLSHSLNLSQLDCSNNPNLSYININNGSNINVSTSNFSSFQNLPNLSIVCLDNVNSTLANEILTDVGHPVSFTSSCNLVPSQSNDINGNIILDIDNNGCTSSDIPMNNLLLESTNASEIFFTSSQVDGSFSQLTDTGNFTSTIFNLPSYFTTSPMNHSSNFVGFNNVDSLNDFCLVFNQVINDVNINIVSLSDARPGFDASYQIIYQNVGSTILSGDIFLSFDSAMLSFLNASEIPTLQTPDSLSFSYNNLNPFETRTIDLNFNVFTPPTVNGGDVLNFIANITPLVGDSTPYDNIEILNQIVINAYDPNDITVYNGPEILLEDSSDYLTYRIRFQNTGTASAVNIVVENELNSLLDWTTFKPLTSSHENRISITDGNQLAFHFENILLPDSLSDEPNSHGWVFYKIKPKSTIIEGDSIFSTAAIFFDYNLPVITNTAHTAVIPDNIAPQANCQDFSTYIDANGQAIISAIDIDNNSTDNIGITSMTINQDTFTCTDLGNNNIIMTVLDAETNSNTCTSIVSILDTLKPSISSQNISIYLDQSGNASITINDALNTISDNCSASASVDVTDFDCSNLGNNTVTLTAIDPSGNSRSTSANILLMDTTSPIVLSQDITVYLDNSGNANISTADIDNGSSDNCSINLSLDTSSFDCTNLGNNTVTLTAIDPSGNSRSTSSNVLVEDNLSPKLLANDISISLDNSNPYIISASDLDAGTYENCDFNLSIDVSSFNTTGFFPVVFSANDGTNTTDTTITVEVTKTVGIYEDEKLNIQVFPNPSSKIFNIQIDENLKIEKVELYSHLGQLVKTESANISKINLDDFSKGIYQLFITLDNGKVFNTKVRVY